MNAYFERFEITMTRAQALSCSQPGRDASPDIERLLTDPRIARQARKLDRDKLREELDEYGAWGDAELADHDANIRRILWIAAGNIREESEQ
jgi:hypothetical protein